MLLAGNYTTRTLVFPEIVLAKARALGRWARDELGLWLDGQRS